ncbi:MAG: hypothetical protein DI537_08685 [Stutzerimonas stutzeri]|nr:MAG: hypothetical protein DI537_08685 [Stutzerimonas stutzeri]
MIMLDDALAYAAKGWPVFPANPAQKPDPFSKAPYLPKASAPGEKDGGHWLARAEPDVIRDWWRRWPQALIGYPTGLRTQCVVVDLDPKEAPVEVMLASLTQFCGRLRFEDPDTGEIIEPAIARTQSGGLHLYFAWPAPEEFAEMEGNLARVGGVFKPTIGNPGNLFRTFLKAGECDPVLANIDVRGEGGYVIAPPSVMADGRAYSWLIPRGDVLPPLPPRLRGVITGEFLTAAERRARAAAREQRRRAVTSEITDRRVKAAVDAAIDKAIDLSRSAPPGSRNRGVYDAAVWLGRIVRGGFLARSEAEGLLYANLPAGVPPTEPKIKHTISNGLDAPVPAFSPAELGPGRSA